MWLASDNAVGVTNSKPHSFKNSNFLTEKLTYKSLALASFISGQIIGNCQICVSTHVFTGTVKSPLICFLTFSHEIYKLIWHNIVSIHTHKTEILPLTFIMLDFSVFLCPVHEPKH